MTFLLFSSCVASGYVERENYPVISCVLIISVFVLKSPDLVYDTTTNIQYTVSLSIPPHLRKTLPSSSSSLKFQFSFPFSLPLCNHKLRMNTFREMKEEEETSSFDSGLMKERAMKGREGEEEDKIIL